ncbi:acyl-CoA dehydrogenase family protein [Ferrovibrio sp.]|uniref:acyl-CoA dehydrogenase family protein n=1 Tax=Ferrovibrio sp. TaxID=1917215 RepID=UPI0035B218BE
MTALKAEQLADVTSPVLKGEDYRRTARAWLEASLPLSYRADHPDYRAPSLDQLKSWEAALYRAGLVGMVWPKAYGGYGRNLNDHLIVAQEIGRLAMPESVNSIGKELAGPIIQAVATEEQKLRYLPAILEMREIWCQGFSEPEAGSDLASLRTRATRIADGWRISGQKIWTSGAAKSQRCLLLARTGPVEERHRGMALFAVKMDTPGISVRTIRSIDDKESFCEVFFDEVEVPDADALGAPDEGWNAAIRVLGIERATNRMYRAWRFENEMRHLVNACRSDPALAALLDDGHYRKRLAACAVDVEVLKGHVETAVQALVAGEQIGSRGSLMKLHWSEAHQRFAALGLELLSQAPANANATIRQAQQRFNGIYMHARAETIYAGTTEVQLGIIADRILKLPKGK